jgi:hypothetical protein
MGLIKDKKIIIINPNIKDDVIVNPNDIYEVSDKVKSLKAVSGYVQQPKIDLLPNEHNIPIIQKQATNRDPLTNDFTKAENAHLILKPNEGINPKSGQVYNKDKYVVYSDGQEFEIHDISELLKFEVKPGIKVKIPPNRLNVKCPFKCQEGYRGKMGYNLIAFTPNMNRFDCCGVTYFK